MALLALVVACGGGDKGAAPRVDAATAPPSSPSTTPPASSPAPSPPAPSATQIAVAAIVSEYRSRIAQNSGSMSDTDAAAIAAFVTAAKDSQYWDKLVDVGPLAGNELAASLVKLKLPTGGAAAVQNAGFASGDYSADRGFTLNGGKSLNTRTNLAALNLQGRFGLSFWLSGQASGWIGSPNNDAPYSMLIVYPASVAAYIGSSGANGPSPSGRDTLFQVIKESTTSTKLFIGGAQAGTTGTAPNTATLRNADVEVFRDTGDTGRGLFYAIDDGTMTDSEAARFHADVRQLMYALGRKIAAPMISAEGSYSAAQSVRITQTPTDSSMAGAAIHYTTDGSTPTTASPVYASAFSVASSMHIRAIAAKNGKVSEEASSWVAIVPEGFTTQKYYTAHVMVNLLAFTPNMVDWVQRMKAAGYNLIWAHLDDYSGNYVTTLRDLMAAADAVGGIQVMPGPSWWVDPTRIVEAYKDTWNHPSIFKIGGKRVYTGWDYQPFNQPTVDSLLAQAGMPRSQFYLWANSRFPYSYDGGQTWVGEYPTASGYPHYESSGPANLEMNVDHLYETRPLDGVINFAVDQGPLQSLITTNNVITAASLRRGKFSMAGIGSFYASVSFMDLGFKGAADLWDSILAAPAGARPNAVSDTTANDYAELSYMSPMVVPPTNGLSFMPPPSAGFNLGDNVRYPLTDHSGIQAFLRPWVDAYLQNKAAPTFGEDKMFAWYWLHPKDAPPSLTIPSIFSGYPHLNQQWWNNQVYATGSISVGGTNQVWGLTGMMGRIRMAAHLSAPAQLKINNTVSEMKPAGAAYFDIDAGAFRGTPTFGIVRSGATIKSASGLQPITDNVFPGGWNFLATEVR